MLASKVVVAASAQVLKVNCVEFGLGATLYQTPFIFGPASHDPTLSVVAEVVEPAIRSPP